MATKYIALLGLIPALLCAAPAAFADFPQDHYYAGFTNSNIIVHHDETGAYLETILLPDVDAPDVRGLTFGPDGLLYVVSGLPPGQGFVVHALDETMTIQESYPVPSGIVCCVVSSGRIFFGESTRFYVTARTGLYEFTIGDTDSAMLLFPGSFQDAARLPSGNFLIAVGDELQEVTSTGVFVREIETPGLFLLYDLVGLLYDPSNDTIYVLRGSLTNNVLHIDAGTGAVLHHATFRYASDLLFSNSGDLVISNWNVMTGVFDKALTLQGSFGGWPADSLAQSRGAPGVAVTSLWMLAVLAFALGLVGVRRLSHRVSVRPS